MAWKYIITLCIFICGTFGCSDTERTFTSDDETAFLALMPTKDMNQSLQVFIENSKESYPFGSEILLIVHNLSSNSIVLKETNPVKLLRIQDNEWVEVGNELTYSGENILSPKGTLIFDTRSIPFQPVINTDKEVMLRAVVIGEFVKDDFRTGDFAVAYIDLHLVP